MFQQILEDWRAVRPANMTPETKAELVEDYTAIKESYQRRADRELLLLDAPDIGPLRRLWRRGLLRIWRRGERTARADIERLRG